MNKVLYSRSTPRIKTMMPAPINDINEDYLRLKKDYRAKISDKTLNYLQHKEVISVQEQAIYKDASAKPIDKVIVTYANAVINVNQKFLEFFETV